MGETDCERALLVHTARGMYGLVGKSSLLCNRVRALALLEACPIPSLFGHKLLILRELRQRRDGRDSLSSTGQERRGAHDRWRRSGPVAIPAALVAGVVPSQSRRDGRGAVERVRVPLTSSAVGILDWPRVPGRVGERVGLGCGVQRSTRREGREWLPVREVGRAWRLVQRNLGEVCVQALSVRAGPPS